MSEDLKDEHRMAGKAMKRLNEFNCESVMNGKRLAKKECGQATECVWEEDESSTRKFEFLTKVLMMMRTRPTRKKLTESERVLDSSMHGFERKDKRMYANER